MLNEIHIHINMYVHMYTYIYRYFSEVFIAPKSVILFRPLLYELDESLVKEVNNPEASHVDTPMTVVC